MMPKVIQLSNTATAALGIMLGFKASYRRTEAKRYGFDFDLAHKQLALELTPLGIQSINKRNRETMETIFQGNTNPGQLGSQTHQYMNQLGFSTDLDRMFGNPMEKLDALAIR